MKNKSNHLENVLEEYLTLLNNHLYFEAHEILEEAWHPLRKENHPLKNLVKGLINGAICFEHLKRNKSDSKRKALTVLNSFERHKHLCIQNILYFKAFQKACLKIESLKKEHLSS